MTTAPIPKSIHEYTAKFGGQLSGRCVPSSLAAPGLKNHHCRTCTRAVVLASVFAIRAHIVTKGTSMKCVKSRLPVCR